MYLFSILIIIILLCQDACSISSLNCNGPVYFCVLIWYTIFQASLYAQAQPVNNSLSVGSASNMIKIDFVYMKDELWWTASYRHTSQHFISILLVQISPSVFFTSGEVKGFVLNRLETIVIITSNCVKHRVIAARKRWMRNGQKRKES